MAIRGCFSDNTLLTCFQEQFV